MKSDSAVACSPRSTGNISAKNESLLNAQGCSARSTQREFLTPLGQFLKLGAYTQTGKTPKQSVPTKDLNVLL